MDNHIETRAAEPPVSGALFFYFNETTGDLVYSDKATYSGDGYTSLGRQTNAAPSTLGSWVFDSKRASIKTVTKDAGMTSKIDVLTRMSSMFYNCSALTSLDLSGFDTSNVTNVSQMFSGCTALASLDLSGFNTSNVTDMGGMFKDCQSLTSLDLSGFDTSNVTKMGGMFRGCQSLTSLDLSSFDTSNVIAMYEMFYGCSDLTSLDLSGFDTSKATNTLNMFNNCNNLRIIDISPNMSNTLSALPADTYYDAITRQSYTKDTIPGGSTYVRDLADLDLVATMVQTRMGINKVKGMLNEVLDLKKQVDASLQQIQSLQDSLSHAAGLVGPTYVTNSISFTITNKPAIVFVQKVDYERFLVGYYADGAFHEWLRGSDGVSFTAVTSVSVSGNSVTLHNDELTYSTWHAIMLE